MTTFSLTDLKSKRAAMTQGEWYEPEAFGDVRAGERAEYIGKANWCRPNLTGIVATHNAADVLIAVCEAALAWRDCAIDPSSKDAAIDGLLAALAKVSR